MDVYQGLYLADTVKKTPGAWSVVCCLVASSLKYFLPTDTRADYVSLEREVSLVDQICWVMRLEFIITDTDICDNNILPLSCLCFIQRSAMIDAWRGRYSVLFQTRFIDTVGVPKSSLVSKSVSNRCENLLLFY